MAAEKDQELVARVLGALDLSDRDVAAALRAMSAAHPEWRTASPRVAPERLAAAAKGLRAGLRVDDIERQVGPQLLELMFEHGLLTRRAWRAARARGAVAAPTADRILRVARVVRLAEATFGEKASAWLERETKALDDASPISLLDSEMGARAVETLLGRIDHGIAA